MHLHLNRRVYLKSAPLHVHLALEPHTVVQAHLTNSLHSLLASASVVQWGTHFTSNSPLSFQPKSLGDGRFCMASRHLLQTPLWYKALFVCKNKAFFVGGIVSMFCVRVHPGFIYKI